MHREDNSKYLLFIEPSEDSKSIVPTEDKYVTFLENLLKVSPTGASSYDDLSDMGGSFLKGSEYKGFHRTACGEFSSNCEHLLPQGFITNSLAAFYLKWYRDSIPAIEMAKVTQLYDFANPPLKDLETALPNKPKTFKYSLKTKDGEVLLQTLFKIGNENHSIPDDWASDEKSLKFLIDYKKTFFDENFDISFEESDTLD